VHETDFDLEIGNYVDQLITLDVNAYGAVRGAYDAARKCAKKPLTYVAAKALKEKIRPNDIVVIATGLPISCISGNIGESDGPPGAAVLGRALSIGLNAIPVLISEKGLTNLLYATCKEVGLSIVDLDEVRRSGKFHVPQREPAVVIKDFPTNDEEAKKTVINMLEDLDPAALIAIERIGMNEKGVYRLGAFDATPFNAKVDYLFKEAKLRGVLTIGIGDHGNELGMANIREYVKKTRYGSLDAVPTVETDYLVVSCISNWGAYGIVACLSALLNRSELMHSAKVESRLLSACFSAGAFNMETNLELIDGADFLSNYTNSSVVEILQTMVTRFIDRKKARAAKGAG
jgi:hypothetical protein